MSGPPRERAYVVRDARPYGQVRHPDAVLPYTLQGILRALSAASWRSGTGTPQEVHVREGNRLLRVVRRFVDGLEVPGEPPSAAPPATGQPRPRR